MLPRPQTPPDWREAAAETSVTPWRSGCLWVVLASVLAWGLVGGIVWGVVWLIE